MKAVILVAGKSTRTHPLTLTRPKAMLKMAGKPLLQHILERLEGLVDETILVVGFKKEMIEEFFGKEFLGIKITYAEQVDQLGTGHALLCAEPFLGMEKFLVLMGDDLYTKKDMESLIKEVPSVLVQEVEDARPFGVWLEKNGYVTGFQEKSENPESNLVNTAIYSLGPEIFQHIKGLKKTSRGEYELNEAVFHMSKDKPVKTVKTKDWLPVGYPWHMLDANNKLLEKMKPKMEGIVEKGAVVKGNVSIGKGTKVLPGSYIEGPVYIGENCLIGPNCFIRPGTSIGNGCRVGNSSEIKNSILGDGSKAPHFNYLGDSIVGNSVNLAGYTFTCNLRHDRGIIKSMIKGDLVETGRNKFGTAIGDDAKLGANTILYCGRKIWPGKTTLPGEVVKRDVE